MSQEKAQLIAPEGTFTVPGLNVAGVVTGGNFVGNVTGAASSIAKGSNLIVGVLTASSFVGDVTGNVTGITSSTDNLILGEVTATSMVGDFTGIASGITGGPNIVAGLVTATKFQGNTPGSSTGVSGGKNINVGTFTASSFAGDLTGNAAGLSTTTANLKLGITSATSFSGDLTGNASELAGSSANLKLGITSASSFAGDLTGNAANLAGSSARLKLGIVTATSFAGNLTGNAANLTGTNANLNLGIVTASSFAGNLTGNVASLSTNDANMRLGIVTASSFAGNLLGNAGGIAANNKNLKLGICSASSFAGDLTGNASAVSGTPNLKLGICTASSFAGNLTGNAAGLSNNTSHANLGIVTATSFSGDASNLTGIAGGAFSQQAVTANGANTAIDISDGNVIYMTQSANTTISFTGISDNTAVIYLIRVKDDTLTPRTITWPSGIIWNRGYDPTILSNPRSAEAQVFKLTTRDNGSTWYADEVVNCDPQTQLAFVTGVNSHIPGSYNNYGAFGVNDIITRSSPVQLPGTTWKYVAGNGDGTLAVKTDGTLWAWGRNQAGALGLNESDSTQRSSPVQIGAQTDWDSLATVMTSDLASFAIKKDGQMWGWGANDDGQLGQNNRTTYSSPVQVMGYDWRSVSAGKNAVAIKNNNTLWMWGNNDGIFRNCFPPSNSPSRNDPRSSPCQMPGNWSSCKTIQQNCLGIKVDGTLWAWGKSNEFGQLGQNNDNPGQTPDPKQVGGAGDNDWAVGGDTVEERMSKVAQGDRCSLAIKANGTLWAFGSNDYGELGQNNRTQYSSPVQIPGTTWKSIGYMARYAFSGLKTDGTLWAWGRNEEWGSLGQNDDNDRSSPTQIPGTYTNIGNSHGPQLWAFKSTG